MPRWDGSERVIGRLLSGRSETFLTLPNKIRISDTACQIISERLHERLPRILQVIPHPLIQPDLGQTASTFIPSGLAPSIIASSRQSIPRALRLAAVARWSASPARSFNAPSPGGAAEFLPSGAHCVGVANPEIQQRREIRQDPPNG